MGCICFFTPALSSCANTVNSGTKALSSRRQHKTRATEVGPEENVNHAYSEGKDKEDDIDDEEVIDKPRGSRRRLSLR